MSQPFPIARASSLVLFALLGLALPSMGCGLLIDKPPPEPSVNPDGGADASRDARAGDATVDATVDAPPACVQDSDCDDGLYCTGREACAGGSCVGTDPVLCDDGIACTEDH
ncbi:MAG: hypothetical protein OEY14_12110, partial [Myxococcales bacterium]|nr:hypothetical protein [Myxococcales bacterium]